MLVLLVDCEAIGEENYPDYNYEYSEDYGDVNVKTTSLFIFSPSVLMLILEYILGPPPGGADSQRATRLDILQSQFGPATLGFWFVFLSSRNISNFSPRSRDCWISDRCGILEVCRCQVRPGQCEVYPDSSSLPS